MSEIKLHVHTCEGVEPKLIEIASDATVEQLLNEMQAAGAAVGESGEEVILWVENEEVACRKENKLHEHGIKHGHHVHCHQCRHVAVFVTHDSQTKEKPFAPSATVQKVHQWAIKEFGLKAEEADEVLYLHDDLTNKLPEHAHVGSFVKFPNCKLALRLACKDIKVTVSYTGQDPFEHKFTPETTVGTVKVKAMELFKLEKGAADKYALQYDGVSLDDATKIGKFGKCELPLVLMLKKPQEKGYAT
jgi:hypothetical protein